MSKKIPVIKALDILKGVSNYVFTIGNTGRVVKHLVLSKSSFEGYLLIKAENLGVVTFQKHKSMSDGSRVVNVYTDPRIINEMEMKRAHERIKSANGHLAYYQSIINEETSRIQRIQVNDDLVITEFLSSLKDIRNE